MPEYSAQEAPYRMLVHGKFTVSSTALAVPKMDYTGTDYNPSTASSLTAFLEACKKCHFFRFKNTHATDSIRYGMDANLTTANGFSLAAGGILQENITTGDPLWMLRGGSADIVVEFAGFSYY